MHKIMLPTGPRLVLPERTPIGLLAAMQAGAVTLPNDQSVQFGDRLHWQNADGVAVIDVSGIITPGTMHIGGLMTGTNWLTRTVAAALAASDITAIAVSFDSPGGYVSGVMDAADELYAAARSSAKPMIGIVPDLAASAAYWLASQLPTLVVSQSATIGSIGAKVEHVDCSAAVEWSGIAVTEIASGGQKTDGSPYRPLDAAARARLQAQLDDIRQAFAEHVARGRSRVSVEVALGTEAGVFSGPTQIAAAVQAGFADEIAHPAAAIAALAGRISNPTVEDVALAENTEEALAELRAVTQELKGAAKGREDVAPSAAPALTPEQAAQAAAHRATAIMALAEQGPRAALAHALATTAVPGIGLVTPTQAAALVAMVPDDPAAAHQASATQALAALNPPATPDPSDTEDEATHNPLVEMARRMKGDVR
jgi:ClpP class serine protease